MLDRDEKFPCITMKKCRSTLDMENLSGRNTTLGTMKGQPCDIHLSCHSNHFGRNFYFGECGDNPTELIPNNLLLRTEDFTPPPVGTCTSGITKLGKGGCGAFKVG